MLYRPILFLKLSEAMLGLYSHLVCQLEVTLELRVKFLEPGVGFLDALGVHFEGRVLARESIQLAL